VHSNKHSLPINFSYLKNLSSSIKDNALILSQSQHQIEFELISDSLLKIKFAPNNQRINYSRLPLNYQSSPAQIKANANNYTLSSKDLDIQISSSTGEFSIYLNKKLACSSTSTPFGFCGDKSIFLLKKNPKAVIYGLGGKVSSQLDLSNRSYRMYNVDVMGEFPETYYTDSYDPGYVSIPFLLCAESDRFFGLYLHNSYPSSIHTGYACENANTPFHITQGLLNPQDIALSPDQGASELYVILGSSLAEVVRSFAKLTGTHELPPVWSLGYHQCRWGYKSADDLIEVLDQLQGADIPTAAIWADIDYMNDYKVFTWSRENFSEEDRQKLQQKLSATDTKLVTIIDPGVKAEPGYEVYDQGIEQELFCQTAEGGMYKGLVWPGQTVFPDFSLQKCQEFWAEHVAGHLMSGVHGIWNDMNEPAIGSVDAEDMLFAHGEVDHAAYHNQYAYLMAQATYRGFELADSSKRPFILSRGGSAGIQNYSALWTGDNCSNETHLAMSIPQALNLSLSGVSFHGCDLGGFNGDTDEELFLSWLKANLLFPFLRNHSNKNNSKPQEPYRFSLSAQEKIREYLDLRLKLLPYIYNQFYLHRENGDPILRPLSYEFSDLCLENISHQYMIGRYLMSAPALAKESKIILPKECNWFDLSGRGWIEGGQMISPGDGINLFVRDGAILPMLRQERELDFSQLDFHIFASSPDVPELLYYEDELFYYEDDGQTKAYQHGEYNLYKLNINSTYYLDIFPQVQNYTGRFSEVQTYYYGGEFFPQDSTEDTVHWPDCQHNVRVSSARIIRNS